MESNHGAAEMIDHTDTQTQQLPLEVKRGRGRPKTGTALTAAEKQKAYRERNKGNVTDNSAEIEALKAKIVELEIALGKEVIARKRAERKLINVTIPKIETTTSWDVEYCHKGKRTWKRVAGPVLDDKETAERVMGNCQKGSDSRYRVVEVSLA